MTITLGSAILSGFHHFQTELGPMMSDELAAFVASLHISIAGSPLYVCERMPEY